MNSAENPADEGSRGMTAKQFVERSKWLEGPEFLKDSEETWQTGDIKSKVDPADPGVKVNVNANVVTEKNDMLSRLDRFSSLNTAKAAVAICLRYKNNLREKAVAKKDELKNRKPESEGRERVSASSLLSVDELQKAEMEIVKMVQSDAFPGEIKNLEDIKADSSSSNRLSDKKKKVVLKKTSALHMLDPFVDSDGILRVGGRIRGANFAQTLKTPIILPKFGHLTKLVVSYIHEKTHHGGRGITMNEQRAHGYWIINGNTVVRRFISARMGEMLDPNLAPPFAPLSRSSNRNRRFADGLGCGIPGGANHRLVVSNKAETTHQLSGASGRVICGEELHQGSIMCSCETSHGQSFSSSLCEPSRGDSLPSSIQPVSSSLGMSLESQYSSECRTPFGQTERHGRLAVQVL